jgi:hypothetical protein
VVATRYDLDEEVARNWWTAKIIDHRSLIGKLFVILRASALLRGCTVSRAEIDRADMQVRGRAATRIFSGRH